MSHHWGPKEFGLSTAPFSDNVESCLERGSCLSNRLEEKAIMLLRQMKYCVSYVTAVDCSSLTEEAEQRSISQ